jgi:hypothetical protein
MGNVPRKATTDAAANRRSATNAASSAANAAGSAASSPPGRGGRRTGKTGKTGKTQQASEERRRKHVPGFELDCGTGPEVRHVGITFVHGIGSQAPGETLLAWGGAIIGLLLDVRVAQHATGDPVIACQLDPGPTESRYIELQLPAAVSSDGTKLPEQHWVMTEAWWAQRVRPPAFGQMAEWLGPRGAIRRILLAILPRARGEHDPRLREWAAEYPLKRDEHGVEEDAEHGNVAGQVSRVPSQWQTALEYVGRLSAGLYLQAISALILVVYGALRSIEKIIPIGPLKNGALTRPIDEFMLDWFGDVYVLLSDPAQAASVRGRLVDALLDLHVAKCDTVVVVAHSGGAIVSYMTLADRANREIRVDRLITLGEGLNLAWLLTEGDESTVDEDTRRRYERLYSDVFDGRPTLSWHDFWASQDPAPVGVLKVPVVGAVDDAELGRIKSHSVWNRLAFGEDHGSYWENDEEFLLPMVRLLDGSPGASRFFGTDKEEQDRSNRRRRRLSILSLWRQLSLIGPTAAIVVAFARSSDYVHRASDAVAAVWQAIPGSEIVSGPLNNLRGLGLETTLPGRVLAETGVWVVAALIGLVAIFALIAPPERPVPWAIGPRKWLSDLLRLVPWIVGLPIVAAVLFGMVQFVTGATREGKQVGIAVGATAGEIIVLAILVIVLFGSPSSRDLGRGRAIVGDFIEMAFTMIVMTLAAFLALAPIVSMIAFTDVGRTVLGSLAVLAVFQILGRIGTWRWTVWDGRERVAARTGKPFPRLRRIVIQLVLLLATIVCLFIAVVADSDVLTLIAAGGAAVAVLLGVSVDVFDASRQERTTPTDMMPRSARA